MLMLPIYLGTIVLSTHFPQSPTPHPQPPIPNQKPPTTNHHATVPKFELQPVRLHAGGPEALCLAYSPDGTYLAAGCADQSVRIWDVHAGKLVKILKGHTDVVAGLAFAPDGKLLATVAHDGTARIWVVPDFKELKSLKGHTNWALSAAFSPDGHRLATGSYDTSIIIWDVKSGNRIMRLFGHDAGVRAVTFAPDGKSLISSGADRIVQIWDIATGEPRATLKGHEGAIRAISVSPDGSKLATASEDKSIKIWSLADNKELHTLTGHGEMVYSVEFSADGRFIVSAGYDASVRFWDVSVGTHLDSITQHSDGINAIALSPSGRQVASAARDETILLHNVVVPRLKPSQSLPGERGPVWLFPELLERNLVAAQLRGRQLQLRELASDEERAALKGHSQTILSVAMHPAAPILASGARDRTIRLWQLLGNDSPGRLQIQRRGALMGHSGHIVTLEYAAQGKLLASGDTTGTVKIWDQSNKLVQNIKSANGPIQSLAFSSDGKWLAVCGPGDVRGEISLYCGPDWAKDLTLPGHDREVTSSLFLEDSQTLLTASENGRLIKWATDRREAVTKREFRYPVRKMILSPDGRNLATGHANGDIILWHAPSLSQLAHLNGHRKQITALSSTVDGKRLFSASEDRVILEWEISGER